MIPDPRLDPDYRPGPHSRDRWFGCERKVPYLTLEQAECAAWRLGIWNNKIIHPYRCRFGGDDNPHWHLGSPGRGGFRPYFAWRE